MGPVVEALCIFIAWSKIRELVGLVNKVVTARMHEYYFLGKIAYVVSDFLQSLNLVPTHLARGFQTVLVGLLTFLGAT